MRTLFLIALLILATTSPVGAGEVQPVPTTTPTAAQPVPEAAPAVPPPLVDVRVAQLRASYAVTWAPPRGQAWACLYRETGNDELITCIVGDDGVSEFPKTPRDVGLLLAAGDEVELRAYDERGQWIGVGRTRITQGWRVWMPVAGKSPRQ